MKAYCEHLARVCLDPNPTAEDLAALGGDPAAWGVYRRLVRSRLGASITAAFPRVIARVGHGVMDGWIQRFLAEAPPRTRYVRAIPTEFVTYLTTHAGVLGMSAVDLDLAALESAIVAVTYDPDPDDHGLEDMAMTSPVVLAPAHRRVNTVWGVEAMPDATGAYVPSPRALLVYRAPVDHRVITLSLTPTAQVLWDGLAAGQPVTEAFLAVARARGTAMDEPTVAGCVDVLTDLLARGLVRGARSTVHGP